MRWLAERLRLVKWHRGRTVLRAGDSGTTMMIVVKGRVKLMMSAPNGRERILHIVGPGETFGEMSMLDGGQRSADAETLEPTTALVLGQETCDGLIDSDPAFARRLIADLCLRVRRTTSLLEDALFLSSDVRLAKRLRTMAKPNGQLLDGRPELVLEGLSQQDLADAVGVSRESVNRQLRAWQDAGFVTLRHRAVVVHDIDGLERLTCALENAD